MISEDQHRLAQGVLVALRATVEAPITDDAVTFLPQLATLPRDAAAQRLAEYRKPITCVALEAHGRLAIGVWQLSREETVGLEELADTLREELGVDDSQIDVIITGLGVRVPLNWAQYKQFQSDYYLPLAALVGKAVRDLAGRIQLVVTVTRARDGELHTL